MCAKLHLRKLREKGCQSDGQWLQDNRTLIFLSHTRWAETEQADGGVTWLELYIWFIMHSGTDEETPLAAKSVLPAELASFKASVRRVNLHVWLRRTSGTCRLRMPEGTDRRKSPFPISMQPCQVVPRLTPNKLKRLRGPWLP